MRWLLLIGCAAVLGGVLDFYLLGHPQKHRQVAVGDTVPTLFLPGYFGTRYSFGRMLKRLVMDKQVVAIVRKNGRVQLRGRLQFGPHVAVQVLFADHRLRPPAQLAGVQAVVAALGKQAPLTQVNLVAHSMGGITALLYTISEPAVPVRTLVTIAAPFNDLEVAKNDAIRNWPLLLSGPSQTAPVYEFFRAHRRALPPALRWLNIAGDLFTGTDHDGVVGVNSSFAIRYLAQNHVAEYVEVLIRGPRAAHSLLHENRLVDHDVEQFIWGREAASALRKETER